MATTSLLATGVLGIVDFVSTFPAIFFVDRFGRRKFFMAGALGMMIGHVVVAGIVGHYDGNFKMPGGAAAGWIGVVFIYVSYPMLRTIVGPSDGAFRYSAPTSPIPGVQLHGSCQPRSSLRATAVKQSASS